MEEKSCYISVSSFFHHWYVMNKRSKEKNCNPTINHLHYTVHFRGLSVILLKYFGSATSLWSQPCTWQHSLIHHWIRPERKWKGRIGETVYMTKSKFFAFSYIVMRMFSFFCCFQKPFMPDKMKCQTWQLTSKQSTNILLNSVSLAYKLLRAETLSCNCVPCAIHIYESIEELVIVIIIWDATDEFHGK